MSASEIERMYATSACRPAKSLPPPVVGNDVIVEVGLRDIEEAKRLIEQLDFVVATEVYEQINEHAKSREDCAELSEWILVYCTLID